MTCHDHSDILGKALYSRLAATAISAAAAAALVSPAPAHAEDWGGLNADRTITYFSSDFGLATGDGNFASDLYANDGSSTTLVSGGKAPGDSEFLFGSQDGSLVYFETQQPLATGDYGGGHDLYVRTPTGTQRITPPGITGGVALVAITPDGSRAWMHTTSALLPADTDTTSDVYEYRPVTKTMVLLTPGTAADAFVEAGSADGTKVLIRTDEALEPGDTDSKLDLYRVENGSYLRMTPGNGPHHAHFNHLGPTSGALVFSTGESLSAADVDGQADIYRRLGLSPAELVSTTNAGAGGKPALFEGADTEAGRLVYRTADALVAADTDTVTDIYAAENGFKALLSDGPDDGSLPEVVAISDSAHTVLLRTISKLLPSDTDLQVDLYLHNDFTSTMTHVNKSNNGFGPVDAAIAPTAKVVAFETYEPLSPQDTDATRDVYVHTPLGIQLASGRQGDGAAAGPIADDVELHTVLPNGHVLFSTSQRLAATDKDEVKDLYDYWSNTLIHVSRDASPPNTSAEISAPVVEGDMAPVDVRADEPGTLECRIDTNSWFDCVHGVNMIGPLAAGTHVLEARATDVAGNVDPTTASVTIVVQSAEGDTPGVPAPVPPSLPVVPTVPAGDTGSAGSVPVADTLAPRLTDTSFRLRRAASVLSLTTSEAASVRVRLERRVDGRWRTVRTVTRTVAAGSHHIRLARRVAGGKHRAVVVATDPAGNSSARLRLALRR